MFIVLVFFRAAFSSLGHTINFFLPKLQDVSDMMHFEFLSENTRNQLKSFQRSFRSRKLIWDRQVRCASSILPCFRSRLFSLYAAVLLCSTYFHGYHKGNQNVAFFSIHKMNFLHQSWNFNHEWKKKTFSKYNRNRIWLSFYNCMTFHPNAGSFGWKQRYETIFRNFPLKKLWIDKKLSYCEWVSYGIFVLLGQINIDIALKLAFPTYF